MKKDFNEYSSPNEVLREIEKCEKEGTKPFRDKVTTTMWNLLVMVGRIGLSLSPLQPLMEPEPTQFDPQPVSLSAELRKPEVVAQAKPVMEDLLNQFPVLEYLGDLGDPRVQLMYTVAVAASSVYEINSRKYYPGEPPTEETPQGRTVL